MRNQRGFTLLEFLAVVVIVGVIAGMAIPSWLKFVEETRLLGARDELSVGIREAREKAQYRGTPWQFSIREQGGSVEWATHSAAELPGSATWQVLDAPSIQIDAESTFDQSDGVRYVVFDDDGNVQIRHLGRITLSSTSFSEVKSCVIVSTVVGALRKSKAQPTADRGGRTCY